jgi:hypothetical protein
MKTSMKRQRYLAWSLLAASLPLLVACGGYYQVTDTHSGKAYYTRDVDHEDGHVRFVDKASGDKVNLDSVEVREVTRQQYENAIRK